ncbi:uncharacterized protein LOC125529908 isoform X1 [Triticum urartu]|uniref:uncharacterized protein LOC125529908 isoform X1 n=1 Tax=Triticum urartu TaxID=4572 RepID=UPI00204387EF|nr:uncharacterized protein LOC125529908 isoform X1 [Triticum urartu]XP_048550286.1 uncharacterized protein LOC125529908 isoform X1 [Triticum urartu]
MEHLVELYSGWEIQLLVLLSFTLQSFLFFAGRLRRRSSNSFLRLCLWAVYLGADLVAVYALGYLSKRQDVTIETNILTRTQPLAFFWAPFLLIHLGGQDTITAFAMEDNNLWLRHLLNLVMQVALALYVFWKSIGKHSADLLLAGSFVFVTGIIKYGERTWSLKCGSLQSLESSDALRYKMELPEGIAGDVGVVRAALDSMPFVLDVMAERNLLDLGREYMNKIDDPEQMIRMVRLQLGMIYDDLYTKSLVLRTRSGVILRCISQASVIVAFVLFHASSRDNYSKADIAITYSLFVGCFFFEVSSTFVSMLSPWTWAWLKVRRCDALASLWVFFCSDIGYPRTMKQQRWPNLIGQYNLHSWLTDSGPKQSIIMVVFRKLFVDLLGVKKKKIFWMSKLLDTGYVDVGSKIVECVAEEISLLTFDSDIDKPNEWPKIGSLLKEASELFANDFGMAIIWMHAVTELLLKKCESSHSDIEFHGTSEFGLMILVCRKLSKYIMYLFIHHPSMLPLSISPAPTLAQAHEVYDDFTKDSVELEVSKETVEEVARMWTRLLVYAAGKSKAAPHVALLSRGGELITFAWLIMAHCGFGDTRVRRLQLTNIDAHIVRELDFTPRHLFNLPMEDQISDSANRRSKLDDENANGMTTKSDRFVVGSRSFP